MYLQLSPMKTQFQTTDSVTCKNDQFMVSLVRHNSIKNGYISKLYVVESQKSSGKTSVQ